MMGLVGQRILVISTMLVGASCALFTDLGDFSSQTKPAPSGSPEASPEAIREDGGASSGADAGLDAGGDACAGLYCEDFDDDGARARITTLIVDPWAPPMPVVGIDERGAASGPRSFFVRADPIHAQSRAALERTFDLDLSRSLRCAFDLRIDQLPADGSYMVVAFFPVDAPAARAASIELRAGGFTRLLDETSGGGASDGPNLPLKQWRRYTATLKRSAPASLVFSDGLAPMTVELQPWPETTKVLLRVGMVWANPYGTVDPIFEMRVDGVRCDAL